MIVPGARIDLDTQFGTHPTPKISLRFDPHETLVLRASYGWGFRAPSFKELLLRFENPSAGYVVEGNPGLEPETSRSINVGAEYHPTKWFWLSVNLFRNDIDNLIFTQTIEEAGAGSPRQIGYVNIASAYTQGVESTARFRVARWVTFELGYTLTDTQDEQEDRPLEGRALHRGTFTTRFHRKRWGLEAMVRSSIVGPRPFYQDDDGDGFEERVNSDPFATLDLRIAKHFGKHVTLFVGAENLLDAGDVALLPIPPRTFYGGLTARY